MESAAARRDTAASMAKPTLQHPKRARRRQFFAEWRKKRGLTQEQLAERIDKSRGLISQLESGLTSYTEETLNALADALSCEPWDLLHVDPSKEGQVVDLLDLIRQASPEQKAEAIGYIKGIVRRN
jgi:transcriptional regulator with XRE-family HTH domain